MDPWKAVCELPAVLRENDNVISSLVELAAIPVEFDLVEPLLASGSSLTSLAYIGSMKRILAGGNALKALGCTRSSNEAVRVV